jgi:hypothetical protein
MGYTDVDKLAINTIRLLAVSFIPPSIFPAHLAPPLIASKLFRGKQWAHNL